jgi:flagellar biosynthesis/type III secretory pathway chaperone
MTAAQHGGGTGFQPVNHGQDAPATETGPLVEELLAALDEAIALEEGAVGELRALSDAATARDDRTLEDLMVRLSAVQARHAGAERRCTRARARLAAALGCPAADVTLPRLGARLPAPQAARLRDRRARIQTAAEAARQAHLQTAVLLAEVARANQALLDGLLPRRAEPRTYGTDGRARGRAERGLLDARL